MVLVAGVLTISACDSVSGIPDEQVSASPSATTTTTTTVAPAPTTTVAPAAPDVPVGEVPGNAAAAPAVARWAADLVAGADLVAKCWTIAPANVREMYTDKDGILAALAQPGIDGQFAVIWRGTNETVSVKRSEIASGYACPRVTPAGQSPSFNDADARHTVRRYLSRWIGKPVNTEDTEGNYPLVCPGSVLQNNPGKLTGTTAYADSEITSAAGDRDAVQVSVPVTNSSGVTQQNVFSLTIGPEGYCISDVE